MEITSLENKKVKLWMELKSPKKRKELGLFLVEGKHLVEEAYKSGLLKEVMILPDEEVSFSIPINIVNEKIMHKLSNLPSYPSIIGLCEIKETKEIIGSSVLLLDNVQDPGNLGTIIRSSCAFNVDTVILSKDSVDVYNDKVLRSSQGMIFHIHLFYADLEEIILKLKKKEYLILGTDVVNGKDVSNISSSKWALIMGNEGQGVRENIKKLTDENLYIKMNKNCESLNVGVATGILLYELTRGSYE